MSIDTVSDVTESFNVIVAGLRDKVYVLTEGQRVVTCDTKEIDIVRQRDNRAFNNRISLLLVGTVIGVTK